MRLEPSVLERREGALLGGLVEQATRLHLDVLPVGVGQELLPDHPLPRQAPDPGLLPQLVVARRVVPHPEVVVVPVGAEEVGLAPDDVVRLVGAEVVLLVECQVLPVVRIDRPREDLPAVPDVVRARVDELKVATCLDPRIHPRVIGLLKWRRVVPDGARGEVGLVVGQGDDEPPVRPREQVEGAENDLRSLGREARLVVDRRRAVGRVADDAVVRLDAAARPRAAHGDVTELDDVVVVHERAAGGLLDRRPDLAADLGQDGDAQVVVLEFDDGPLLVDGPVGVAVEPVVGVDAPHLRDRIGVRERIRADDLSVLSHGGPAGGGARRDRRRDHQAGCHPHPTSPRRHSGAFYLGGRQA